MQHDLPSCLRVVHTGAREGQRVEDREGRDGRTESDDLTKSCERLMAMSMKLAVASIELANVAKALFSRLVLLPLLVLFLVLLLALLLPQSVW